VVGRRDYCGWLSRIDRLRNFELLRRLADDVFHVREAPTSGYAHRARRFKLLIEPLLGGSWRRCWRESSESLGASGLVISGGNFASTCARSCGANALYKVAM